MDLIEIRSADVIYENGEPDRTEISYRASGSKLRSARGDINMDYGEFKEDNSSEHLKKHVLKSIRDEIDEALEELEDSDSE